MPAISLTEPQQHALRSLAATDAVPGAPLPHRRVLEDVARLIPCDTVAVTVADTHRQLLTLMHEALPGIDRPRVRKSPLPRGPRWVRQEPERLRRLIGPGAVDALLLGCANGVDVVLLCLERHAVSFAAHDLALLRLLEPILERLLRERPAPHLPDELTAQERRVLRLVAAGRSNAEIADLMGIASSTVRKHLEHAYPKLGVTNRFAAALAFEGRHQESPGDRPIEMFA